MDSLWDQWKAKYNVQYATAEEDAERFAVFCQNYDYIQEFNAAHPNTKLALNKFSAYTNDEFRALFTGYNHGQFDASSAYTVSLDDKTTSTTESSKKASSASKTSSKSASKSASQSDSKTASKTASQSDSKTSSKASSKSESESKSESKTASKKASSVPGLWGSATTGEMQGTEFDSAHSIFSDSESDSNNGQRNLQSIPSTWNWVQQGALNPVQNQGECGSCWSFSTTAAMEALYFINNQQLPKLAEQQLVDCDRKDFGCNGGAPIYAMEYVAQFGQMEESQYPYTGTVGSCAYNAQEAIQGITTGGNDVTPNNAEALKAAIYSNPTVVAVEATQVLQSYSSGVITPAMGCTANLDHAVLAVGYGSFNNEEDAFMVRNSWGPDWGVQGYFYVSTENSSNNGAGTCGILGGPVQPQGRKQ